VSSLRQPRARQKSRSRLIIEALLRSGAAALVLALLFHFLPSKQVFLALERLPARLWLLVLVAYLATHCLGVGKWRLMVNTAGAGLNYLQAAHCYFAGLFGSLVLPSLIGGDLVRAALGMRYGRTKAGVLLGSVVDRIVDFAGLILLAISGALIAPHALQPQSRRVFLWIAAAAIVVAIGLAAIVAIIPIKKLSFRMRRRAASLRRAARSMATQPRAVLVALCISIGSQLSFIALSLALAYACGLHLPFQAWLFAWPLAKLSAAIPITQGGIGVREAALAALLVPFGASPALTVAAGLAWEAIAISGALVAGGFALVSARRASHQWKPALVGEQGVRVLRRK
jgi:glycosyltransferase 2 family protein